MSMPPRLCLIEDDAIMGESLYDRFLLEGYECDWFQRADAARAGLVSKRYAAVVSDIRLPDISGDVFFTQMQADALYLPPWLFITGYGTIERAVALLKAGATDYITKPFDLDQLLDKLRLLTLAAPVTAESISEPTLGVSAAMRHIEALLLRLATRAATVLITGESGVGKEVVARELHRLDPRTAHAPFIAVNCGALSESLLEAELFGYEKGAFTGAARTKPGVFEQANGGTLFLDEIGDMPLSMQVKLLRVVQDKRIVRVGGERIIPVSLRLVCATHRNLKKEVETGRFREDLFYRINVIHLGIAPLRERPDDISWLAHRFLEEANRSHATLPLRFSPAALQALFGYSWPGNVRELKHAIERAIILCPGPELTSEALLESAEIGSTEEAALNVHIAQCEARYIRAALARHAGRIAETAGDLGISRKSLWEKMRRLGIMSVPEKTQL